MTTLFTKVARAPQILEKALLIDEAIKSELVNRKTISEERIKEIVERILPSSVQLGAGVSKIAFKVTFVKKGRNFVLKVVKNLSKMPTYIKPYLISGQSSYSRNRYFLKHYWATETCILQRFAQPVDESDPNQMKQVKKLRKKFRDLLCDLRIPNLGVDGGKVKIIDACSKRDHVKFTRWA